MDSKGVNYTFFSEPDASLICCICLEVASQPKQCEDCGKLFCRTCIEKNEKKPCPSCRVENPNFFKDAKSAREILQLKVRCSDHERGCDWTGTIRTLDEHNASCQFAIVSCPNECGELTLMRMEVVNHTEKCPLRAFECQDCGKKDTYLNIQDHRRVCDEVIMACPNEEKGCPVSMARGKIDQHVRDDCEYIEVSCVYENLGCDVRMLRRDIVKHQENDDKHHLRLALGIIGSPREKCKMLGKDEAFVFKLTDFSTKKTNNQIFESEPFYSHPGGYKMCVVVYPNGDLDGESTHLSVRIKILPGPHDKSLVWPFCGYMSCELLNQLSNDNHHHTALFFFYKSTKMFVGSCKGNVRFLSLCVLSDSPSKEVQYLVDDNLYFRVTVKVNGQKLWLKNEKISNFDRHLSIRDSKPNIFKITGYSVKKAADSYFSFKPFYVYPYSLELGLYANGYGTSRNQQLSVCATVQRCPDISGACPDVKSVDFTLLNQLENKKHLNKSVNCEQIESEEGFFAGVDDFIAHSELSYNIFKQTRYLKDDTLYLKIAIVLDNDKPWLVGGHSSWLLGDRTM